jgi:dTDP-4-amino-4,6-dideoxygalactose transaminase
LLEIARRHRCALIEDAAHAFPSRYEGNLIGSTNADSEVPTLTAFSFYATKNLTTGEGGMLTGPADLIEKARPWSLHGISRDVWTRDHAAADPWFYEVVEPGFKYNMSDIQAALGIAQLAKTQAFFEKRTKIAGRYNDAFRNVPELELPALRPDSGHSWHIYALRLHLDRIGISRSQFIAELRKRNIAASVHFIPVHLHPYYARTQGYKPSDFPIAFREYKRLVSLPIYPAMSDRDVADVIEAVCDIAAHARTASTLHAAVDA